MSLLADLAASAKQCQRSDGAVLTQQFLKTCSLVLPVIEQMGTGMLIVKNDVQGNIDRLSKQAATDPTKYQLVTAIVEDEVSAGKQSSSTSCTKGLLWLKRAMEFLVAILQQLENNSELSMSIAVPAAYDATLKKFHGFLVYGTFKVALNLVPSRESFLQSVAKSADQQQVQADLKAAVNSFSPVLAAIHKYLSDNGLDDPATV